jgi:transcriptional regulator with XRE-family HTH domain
MSLGDELRKARTDADMTQEELARKAKLDRAYISLLENDRKSPTVDTLSRLCRAIGIAASTLLARAERAERRMSGRKSASE